MSADREPITELRVGRLLKAHGLKGALKLELYTDDPEGRFTPGAEFTLQVPTTSPWHGKSVTVKELRFYNGHPVLFLEGVDDRTAAESLVKAILWVAQDPEKQAEDDAWYHHQLVGLRVERESGEVLGEVARIEHFPAQDLIVVSTQGDDVLVPFVKQIVPTVDLAGRRIVVTPPGGLFEPVAEEGDAAGDSEASSAQPSGDDGEGNACADEAVGDAGDAEPGDDAAATAAADR